jgi:hypothetical protein
MKKIKFTDSFNIPKQFYPKPASKELPQWYKDTSSYGTPNKYDGVVGNFSNATIKKCIPVFDALTSGYIIYSHCDVYVTQEIDDNGKLNPKYNYSSSPGIELHPIWQGDKHPARMIDFNTKTTKDFPKWMNTWVIETPPGYSCLFIQPVHRESVFTILTGIVDTDKYVSNVNFPFVLNNSSFEGLIPAGTPVAQVIPFKRDSWKLEFENKENINKNRNIMQHLRSKFFDAYKLHYWSTKHYK